MNKQELIEKINKIAIVTPFPRSKIVDHLEVIKLIEQLDEPQPVKVPQCVADWITHSKNIGRSLFGAMSIFEENFEIKKWMQWAENQETFARAWLDGYEVEEEKRYLVRVKGISGYCQYLNQLLSSKEYFFASKTEIKGYRIKHTRKELEEADFGWVFDCPGIEIEEVE